MYPTRREMPFLPGEDPVCAMQGFTVMRLTPLSPRRGGPSPGRWPRRIEISESGAAHRIVLPRSAGWLGTRLGSTPRRRWRDQPPLGGDLECVADRRFRTAEVCGEPGHRPTLPAARPPPPHVRPTSTSAHRSELVFPEPLRVQVGKSTRGPRSYPSPAAGSTRRPVAGRGVRGRDAAAGCFAPALTAVDGVDAAGRASTVAAPSKIPSLLVRITTRPSA